MASDRLALVVYLDRRNIATSLLPVVSIVAHWCMCVDVEGNVQVLREIEMG